LRIVLAAEVVGQHEPAVALHEEQPLRLRYDGQRIAQLVDVARKHRREVGVDQRRFRAAHELDQRLDLVGGGHLAQTGLAGEGGDAALVFRVAVAVQQADCNGGNAVADTLRQGTGQRLLLQRHEHLSLGRHSLVCFDHAAMERCRLHDIERENIRPVLVADGEAVGESFGDDQRGRPAAAFEQRIRRHGRSHLDGRDRNHRTAVRAPSLQHLSNAFRGGVGVALRIFREQLGGLELAIRSQCNDIGKRAAPIDPELPAVEIGHRNACDNA
jgi:hypothetical protein